MRDTRTQKEPCLLCSTINHVYFTGREEAYQCGFCHNTMWIDDQARIAYMGRTGRSLAEANDDLYKGKPIFAAVGQNPEDS